MDEFAEIVKFFSNVNNKITIPIHYCNLMIHEILDYLTLQLDQVWQKSEIDVTINGIMLYELYFQNKYGSIYIVIQMEERIRKLINNASKKKVK